MFALMYGQGVLDESPSALVWPHHKFRDGYAQNPSDQFGWQGKMLFRFGGLQRQDFSSWEQRLNGSVRGVALDGNHVITGAKDGFVRIWNVSTGAFFKDLEGHDCPIHAVAVHGGVFETSYSQGGSILGMLRCHWIERGQSSCFHTYKFPITSPSQAWREHCSYRVFWEANHPSD